MAVTLSEKAPFFRKRGRGVWRYRRGCPFCAGGGLYICGGRGASLMDESTFFRGSLRWSDIGGPHGQEGFMRARILNDRLGKLLHIMPSGVRHTATRMPRRFELLPQMRDYDRLQLEWMPYLMFRGTQSFQSPSCHTDAYGFRITHANGQALHFDAFQSLPGRKGIVAGGSFAFGVGASRDQFTIPSLLNRNSDTTWYNLAGRAFNSTQEVMMFQLYLPQYCLNPK